MALQMAVQIAVQMSVQIALIPRGRHPKPQRKVQETREEAKDVI